MKSIDHVSWNIVQNELEFLKIILVDFIVHILDGHLYDLDVISLDKQLNNFSPFLLLYDLLRYFVQLRHR